MSTVIDRPIIEGDSDLKGTTGRTIPTYLECDNNSKGDGDVNVTDVADVQVDIKRKRRELALKHDASGSIALDSSLWQEKRQSSGMNVMAEIKKGQVHIARFVSS
jgi:hypothetical protein